MNKSLSHTSTNQANVRTPNFISKKVPIISSSAPMVKQKTSQRPASAGRPRVSAVRKNSEHPTISALNLSTGMSSQSESAVFKYHPAGITAKQQPPQTSLSSSAIPTTKTLLRKTKQYTTPPKDLNSNTRRHSLNVIDKDETIKQLKSYNLRLHNQQKEIATKAERFEQLNNDLSSQLNNTKSQLQRAIKMKQKWQQKYNQKESDVETLLTYIQTLHSYYNIPEYESDELTVKVRAIQQKYISSHSTISHENKRKKPGDNNTTNAFWCSNETSQHRSRMQNIQHILQDPEVSEAIIHWYTHLRMQDRKPQIPLVFYEQGQGDVDVAKASHHDQNSSNGNPARDDPTEQKEPESLEFQGNQDQELQNNGKGSEKLTEAKVKEELASLLTSLLKKTHKTMNQNESTAPIKESPQSVSEHEAASLHHLVSHDNLSVNSNLPDKNILEDQSERQDIPPSPAPSMISDEDFTFFSKKNEDERDISVDFVSNRIHAPHDGSPDNLEKEHEWRASGSLTEEHLQELNQQNRGDFHALTTTKTSINTNDGSRQKNNEKVIKSPLLDLEQWEILDNQNSEVIPPDNGSPTRNRSVQTRVSEMDDEKASEKLSLGPEQRELSVGSDTSNTRPPSSIGDGESVGDITLAPKASNHVLTRDVHFPSSPALSSMTDASNWYKCQREKEVKEAFQKKLEEERRKYGL